ncbi:hypothetical protein BC938DRAFT_482977 [Jimgerdemannia flammicorona]|uniref:Uncharacterized protein n=1 Tax=Jimgerdemannia flammicorona TaxID=994334 RepID=A0A433QVZ6_9FUNG|nr:hypothetical protein BC938DRAFT_482977 [Jimgerdemannia flammicorona]
MPFLLSPFLHVKIFPGRCRKISWATWDPTTSPRKIVTGSFRQQTPRRSAKKDTAKKTRTEVRPQQRTIRTDFRRRLCKIFARLYGMFAWVSLHRLDMGYIVTKFRTPMLIYF